MKRIKRKISVALIFVTLALLVGCSNSTSYKAMEEGKIALASKEYEKAEGLFKLAYDENNKNQEAKELYDLLENYLLVIEEMKIGNYEKAKELITNINNNENKSMLEKEIKLVMEQIEGSEKYNPVIQNIKDKLSREAYSEGKELAEKTIEEVKGIAGVEATVLDLLNKCIEGIEKENANQQAKINEYKDKIKKIANPYNDIMYIGPKFFEGTSDMPKDLANRNTFMFKEIRENSPGYYFYDEEANDVFYAAQGQVFWVNNGNRNLVEEMENAINITLDEAHALVNKYVVPVLKEYERKDPTVAKDLFMKGYELIGITLPINENNNNFYSVIVTDDRMATTKFCINATNGNIYRTSNGEKIN